jgi:RHH-type transcriptional regulator, proline utilization regulon repressor / proline dehydrogenase / delta 1-pyrroline-5-carboxylate dehydrogenase
MKTMIFTNERVAVDPLFTSMAEAYRLDEATCLNTLLEQAQFSSPALARIQISAEKLVRATRLNRKKQGGLDRFLHQYDLSSPEGITLMCLAESLLRIPDTYTVDKLISDKLSKANWYQHLSIKNSLFVNAATLSLLLTGKLYAPMLNSKSSFTANLTRYISRITSYVIRPIIMQGMKIIGKQYVMGRTINEAIIRAKILEKKGYRHSYDMLGEAARTKQDAEKYFQSYVQAINAIGKAAIGLGPIKGPGISVKLSALHPRYEYSQRERVLAELAPQLLSLAQMAKACNIGLTVDAEETERLELSLEVFEKVFSDTSLNGWEGLGLAVQAYQKRAPWVIEWLIHLSQKQQRRIMIRLVKGAYWDAEIKQAQMFGLSGYPVFTRKNATDVSYLACAKKILAHPQAFYAQFGTHNAYSVAAITEMAGNRSDFEFQCLHGMGQVLYDNIVGDKNYAIPCRIYAPVGSHKDLLGYLVRRLLENGANTSFINRIADDSQPMHKLINDPVARMLALASKPHPHIPLPQYIYGQRKNSKGIDMSNTNTIIELKKAMNKWENTAFAAYPMLANKNNTHKKTMDIKSPANTTRIVGQVSEADISDVEYALSQADQATSHWANKSVEDRAACLELTADLLEAEAPRLLTLLALEAGKTLNDGISEIREAVDFCRYYAERAKQDLKPLLMQGPTGEKNELSLHARGIIICISPWNFPLAIFMGQIVAALVTGNVVIAKPAEQTPLIATEAVKLLHKAGIPTDVLQLLPGRGEIVGAGLVADIRVAGVMFTGSTETAKAIQQTLASRSGPIVPLVAETGGQNAMIVDSSALPEQVVADVIQSAFNSAGQRCSALRVLFLQTDIAERVITMLKGAMDELNMGDPCLLSTDIGPVIDAEAQQMLKAHAEKMQKQAKIIYQYKGTPNLPGYFFPPCVFELESLDALPKEVFGPILHIIRFKNNELDKVMNDIIHTGYGLTLGIHSRIDATIDYIQQRMPVGNIYVNRNIIGAVVGVQPFGGQGLSGTGPKAGGPHYLPRLCVERAISINTTAAGGNTTLVSLNEDE